jgi:hypothetical protein
LDDIPLSLDANGVVFLLRLCHRGDLRIFLEYKTGPKKQEAANRQTKNLDILSPLKRNLKVRIIKCNLLDKCAVQKRGLKKTF